MPPTVIEQEHGLHETPVAITIGGAPLVDAPNPFHANKLSLHADAVHALAAGQIVAPRTVEVDLTDGACNQACGHCSFGSGKGKKMERIDPDALLTTLDEMYSLGTRGVEIVGGGEPTAHPKITEIVQGISDIGKGDMDVGIITNGLMAQRLLPVADNDNVKYIRVSLDAADPEMYAQLHGVKESHFNRVVNNIRKLRSEITAPKDAMKLGIGYLILPPYNQDKGHVVEGAKLADELGADYIAYRPGQLRHEVPHKLWREGQRSIAMARTVLASEGSETAVFGGTGLRWDTLRPDAHPTGKCDARPIMAVIQANGDIAHCILYRNEREMSVGNIYNGSFADQWFSDEHKKVWEEFEISGCPNPCKVANYGAVVRRVADGEDLAPVFPDAVAHHNFI